MIGVGLLGIIHRVETLVGQNLHRAEHVRCRTDVTKGNLPALKISNGADAAVGAHNDGAVIIRTAQTNDRGGICQFVDNHVLRGARNNEVDRFVAQRLRGCGAQVDRKEIKRVASRCFKRILERTPFQLQTLDAFHVSDGQFPGFGLGRNRSRNGQHSASEGRVKVHGDSPVFNFVPVISGD